MKENNQEVRRTINIIKNSFNELKIPVLKETVNKQGMGVVKTEIDDDSYRMFLEVVCRPNDTNVNIKAGFSVAFTFNDDFGFCQIMNLINGQLMDIGHFAVNLSTGEIFLQTGLDISDKDSSQKQLIYTLVRLITQASSCFNMLLRVGNTDQCPLMALKAEITEMLEKRPRERKE
jgi:hypothetical protein